MTFDTCGFFARSIADVELIASALRIPSDNTIPNTPFSLPGAKIGFFTSPNWPNAGPGTRNAWSKAQEILRAHGANISDIPAPENFDKILDWHADILTGEGRSSFLGHYLLSQNLSPSNPDQVLSPDILRHLNNERAITTATLNNAYDSLAALRPIWDSLAAKYDIVITPSVVDEAPKGLEHTGDMSFCSPWTALQVPAVNLPGFKGESGLPVGLTAVGGRGRDKWVLFVCRAVGEVFEREGGWIWGRI